MTAGIVKYILGVLLHYANRSVPLSTRVEFYKLKSELLLKYGTKTGTDIQHIKKECHSCYKGVFKCDWKLPEECWSCDGTGVYKEFWTRLHKYKLGKWTFHIPVERMEIYEPIFEGESFPIIEGYIDHKIPKHRMARECTLWLFLLFDRESFCKELPRVGIARGKRTPLVIIGNALFNFKHFNWRDLLPSKKSQYEYDIEDLPF